jgi:hypothetical protein
MVGSQTPRTPSSVRAVVLLLLAALIPRLVLAALSYGASFDINSWHLLGQAILHGENPYGPAGAGRANWGPVWPWTCGLMLALGHVTYLPFHFLIKVPASLADVGIALLIRHLLLARGLPQRTAFLVALGYALDPVAILVSGAHGQFDAMPALLALGALAAFPALLSSALLLGLGIATKTWVALLLPFFLQRVAGWRSRTAYGVLAVIPFVALLLPYYVGAPAGVREHVLAYAGGVDHGWAAVLRVALNFAHGARRISEMTTPTWILPAGRLLVLAGLLVVLVAARRKPIEDAVSAALLAFYVTSAGVGTQYFLWLLPFAHLRRERWLVAYVAAALIAAIGFYLVFFPEVFYGFRGGTFAQSVLHSPLRPALSGLWILGTAVWWLGCIVWLLARLRAAHTAAGQTDRAG